MRRKQTHPLRHPTPGITERIFYVVDDIDANTGEVIGTGSHMVNSMADAITRPAATRVPGVDEKAAMSSSKQSSTNSKQKKKMIDNGGDDVSFVTLLATLEDHQKRVSLQRSHSVVGTKLLSIIDTPTEQSSIVDEEKSSSNHHNTDKHASLVHALSLGAPSLPLLSPTPSSASTMALKESADRRRRAHAPAAAVASLSDTKKNTNGKKKPTTSTKKGGKLIVIDSSDDSDFAPPSDDDNDDNDNEMDRIRRDRDAINDDDAEIDSLTRLGPTLRRVVEEQRAHRQLTQPANVTGAAFKRLLNQAPTMVSGTTVVDDKQHIPIAWIAIRKEGVIDMSSLKTASSLGLYFLKPKGLHRVLPLKVQFYVDITVDDTKYSNDDTDVKVDSSDEKKDDDLDRKADDSDHDVDDPNVRTTEFARQRAAMAKKAKAAATKKKSRAKKAVAATTPVVTKAAVKKKGGRKKKHASKDEKTSHVTSKRVLLGDPIVFQSVAIINTHRGQPEIADSVLDTIFDLFRKDHICLTPHFDQVTQAFVVSIALSRSLLSDSPSKRFDVHEVARTKQLVELLRWATSIALPSSGNNIGFNPLSLYSAMLRPVTREGTRMFSDNNGIIDKTLVAAGLLPTLRPYQKEGVTWMLSREDASSTIYLPSSSVVASSSSSSFAASMSLGGDDGSDEKDVITTPSPSLPWLTNAASCTTDAHGWVACSIYESATRASSSSSVISDTSSLSSNASHRLFYNRYTGALATQPNGVTAMMNGGILSEEMGLGKTVELLSLVLAHPRPAATMIMTPPPPSSASFGFGLESKDNNGDNDGMNTTGDDDTPISVADHQSSLANERYAQELRRARAPPPPSMIDDPSQNSMFLAMWQLNHNDRRRSGSSAAIPSSARKPRGSKKEGKKSVSSPAVVAATTTPARTSGRKRRASAASLLDSPPAVAPLVSGEWKDGVYVASASNNDNAPQSIDALRRGLWGGNEAVSASPSSSLSSMLLPKRARTDDGNGMIAAATTDGDGKRIPTPELPLIDDNAVINVDLLSDASGSHDDALPAAAVPAPVVPVVPPIISCYCGMDEDTDDLDAKFKPVIQCDICRTWQHSLCMAMLQCTAEQKKAYVCPTCTASGVPIPIKATLIVCPDAILDQWVQESNRHVRAGAMRVLVYTGLRISSDTSMGTVEEKVKQQIARDHAKQVAIEQRELEVLKAKAEKKKLRDAINKAKEERRKAGDDDVSDDSSSSHTSDDDATKDSDAIADDETVRVDEDEANTVAIDDILAADDAFDDKKAADEAKKNEKKRPGAPRGRRGAAATTAAVARGIGAKPKATAKSKSRAKSKGTKKKKGAAASASATPKRRASRGGAFVGTAAAIAESKADMIAKKDRSPLAAITRPQQLADYDVILTTYSVLRNDLYHVAAVNDGNKAMRYRKKYRVLYSPLPSVQWWRVCLDEAQMVGEGTTKCAEMALLLPAINRWGVTGTPIPRSLDDLFGLIVFLGIQPYCNAKWWSRCIAQPFEHGDTIARDHLHWLLKQIVWRRSKTLVNDQLGIPLQTQMITRLHFTGVERYYYRRRHEECWSEATKLRKRTIVSYAGRRRAGNVLGDASGPVDVIDLSGEHKNDDQSAHHNGHSVGSGIAVTKTKVDIAESDPKFKKLLLVLRRIRQACCHPQVGSKTGLISLEKSTMTMDQLTEQLALKAQHDCQESQRLLFAAILGQAALALLDDNRLGEAEALYRQVLDSEDFEDDEKAMLAASESKDEIMNLTDDDAAVKVEPSASSSSSTTLALVPLKKKREVKVDKPQRIHACHNLAHVMERQLAANTSLIKAAHDAGASGNMDAIMAANDECKKEIAKLHRQVTVLKKVYLKRPQTNLRAASEKLHVQTKYVSQYSQDQLLGWFNEAFITMKKPSSPLYRLAQSWIDRIKAELKESRQSLVLGERDVAPSWINQFRDVSGLQLLLNQGVMELLEARQKAMSKMEKLSHAPQPKDVEISSNCRKCRLERSGAVCPHCHADVTIHEYEAKLFRFRHERKADHIKGAGTVNANLIILDKKDGDDDKKDDDNNMMQSVKMDSEMERIFKSLASFVRTHFSKNGNGSDDDDADDENDLPRGATDMLTWFTAAKKELKEVRAVWQAQYDQLSALDELDMCTSRITLRHADEKVPIAERKYKILAGEAAQMEMQLKSEQVMNNEKLQRQLGQLRYLQQLTASKASQDSSSSGTMNGKRKEPSSSSSSSAAAAPTSDNNDSDTAKRIKMDNNDSKYGDGHESKDSNGSSSSATSSSSADRKPIECGICQEIIPPGDECVVLPCAHGSWCVTCIVTMLEKDKAAITSFARTKGYQAREEKLKCPHCRLEVVRSECRRIIVQGNKVDGSKPVMSAKKLLPDLNDPTALTSAPPTTVIITDASAASSAMAVASSSSSSAIAPNSDSVSVNGSWGTKIEAVVRTLLSIIQQDCAAKCLVFSEWPDVLMIVARALRDNHIGFLQLQNGRSKFQKVVTQFKLDTRYRALLMSTRHGANGLNLIEATHVLMVEPLLNNGADAQAVNRVHRIGQTKETYVHRFVVQHTVEEKVWQFAHSAARRSGNNNNMDDIGDIATAASAVSITATARKGKGAMEDNLTLHDIDQLLVMDESAETLTATPSPSPSSSSPSSPSGTAITGSRITASTTATTVVPPSQSQSSVDAFSATLAEEASHRRDDDAWWNTSIIATDGRIMTRTAALPILQRLHRFDRRPSSSSSSAAAAAVTAAASSSSSSSIMDGSTIWHSREVSHDILRQLLTFSESTTP